MHVYIAGPYTTPDPITNARKAMKIGEAVMILGHTPFVPHLNVIWDFVTPMPYDTWLDWDIKWLSKCDAMLRIPGESPGADIEEAYCVDNGIPVYHGIDEFRAAVSK